MKRIVISIIVVFSVFFTGCSYRMLDFTMVSSKNLAIDVPREQNRVSAKAGSVKGAVDKAIEKAGPGYDALIDGVIYRKETWLLLIVIYNYEVEGTPVKSSEINGGFRAAK